MSHTVVVEYVDFPAEVDAVCERCSEIADEISKKLSLLKNNAAETGSRMAQDYIRQLEQQAEEITEKYREFTSRIGAMDRSEKIRLREAGSIRAQVADLKGRLNSVLYNGIDSAGALIREQIFAEAEKNYRAMMNQLNGTASISFEQQKFLASIDDVCLREQVYRMLCSKDAGNDLQQLLEQARQKMSETRNKALNSSKTELLRSLKERIVKYNVPTDRIDRIIREDLPLDSETLAEINREVEDKINAELIRKKAVAVILKSIRKQGFIVDLKQCIKLDPKTNTVNIAVKRPDGKMVQFEVNLDGSFMYHFEGYDGMTCLKDEDGFNETLEKVYGMQITGKKVIWENPDRTASMKRQSIKSSSGHLKS